MYQKHSLRPKKASLFRTKRFRSGFVMLAACMVGTVGAYTTVIGPRLNASGSLDIVDQSQVDELQDQELIGLEGSNPQDTQETGDEQGAETDESLDQTGPSDTDQAAADQSAEEPGTEMSIPTAVDDASGGYLASWSTNVLAGKSFYLGSHNPAATTADEWRATRPDDAALMDTVAAPAKGIWLVMGLSNISSYVSGNASTAAAQGKLPIFVLYGMPTVGCGGLGSTAVNTYLSWVDQIDAALANEAVIIIEPDELPLSQCGGDAETGREAVLRAAVSRLAGSGRHLYIDAGHGSWVGASTMAERLQRSGVEMTQGFSLNVSNYTTTAVNTSYGNSLSSLLGGAHFVIDTSRNGIGPDPTFEWCNAPGRALGELPTTYNAGSKLNALIWAKYPGESDGSCNGGPSEGQWWPEYALELAKNAQ